MKGRRGKGEKGEEGGGETVHSWILIFCTSCFMRSSNLSRSSSSVPMFSRFACFLFLGGGEGGCRKSE